MRLGIFGGTFNPIHYGHLRAAEEARFKNGLDKVIFIPSGNPPLKASELADIPARYLMTQLAIASNPDFIISDMELRCTDKSYTVKTITSLKEIYQSEELFLILGIDAFLDMQAWLQPDKIIEIIDFIVVAREGYNFSSIIESPYIKHDESFKDIILNAGSFFNDNRLINLKLISGRKITLTEITPIGISSTHIRNLIKNNKSIRYLLPEKVEAFIYEHTLYGSQK